MKEKFTQEEWEHLKLVPLFAPILVAGADGKIDAAEQTEMERQVNNALTLKDPLHRELLSDLAHSDLGALLREVTATPRDQFLSKVKGVLKAKLTSDEYQRFIGSIFVNGIKVAKASGGGFLGLGDKVSEEEKKALAVFAAAFDLDPESLKKFFSK